MYRADNGKYYLLPNPNYKKARHRRVVGRKAFRFIFRTPAKTNSNSNINCIVEVVVIAQHQSNDWYFYGFLSYYEMDL